MYPAIHLWQGVVRRFAREHAVWEAAVEAIAELDALMSLAAVAEVSTSQGPMCRPKLLEPCGEQQVRILPRWRIKSKSITIQRYRRARVSSNLLLVFSTFGRLLEAYGA